VFKCLKFDRVCLLLSLVCKSDSIKACQKDFDASRAEGALRPERPRGVWTWLTKP
jgi:hypothetical protein